MTERALRVAIWCAVSTPEQAAIDKDSLPEQEAAGRAWAAERGGQVTRVYTVPGHTRHYQRIDEAERDMPAYRELTVDCERRAFDVLWCRHRNRLGRTLALIATVEGIVREVGGAEVYSAFMPHEPGTQTGSQATLMGAIEGWQSEADNLERSAKHRMGMRARVAKRQLHPNRWPLGYTAVFDEHGACTGAEFDEYIETVSLITRLFLAGVSYSRILRALWDAACTCGTLAYPAGQASAGGHVLPAGKRWYSSLVRRTMLNDTYAGFVFWGGARNQAPSDRFPALWDAETHRAIIRERERRAEMAPTPLGGPFSGGVAYCARCGWRMSRVKSRHEGLYYIRCNKHARKTMEFDRAGCHPNHILESKVCAALGEWLARFTAELPEDSVALIADAVREDTGLAELEQDLARVRHRLETLEAERRRLLRAHAAGGTPLEVYQDVAAAINAEVAALEGQGHKVEAAIRARPSAAERANWLAELLSESFRHLDQIPDEMLGTALRGAGIRIYCENNEVKVIGFHTP